MTNFNASIENIFDHDCNYHKGDDLMVCFDSLVDNEPCDADGVYMGIPYGLCFNSEDLNIVNQITSAMKSYNYPTEQIKQFVDDVNNKDYDLIDSIDYYISQKNKNNFIIFDDDLFNAYSDYIDNLIK